MCDDIHHVQDGSHGNRMLKRFRRYLPGGQSRDSLFG